MKKKLAFTTLLLLLSTYAISGPIGQRVAQQKAASLFDGSSMSLVATGTGERPAYYVFNARRKAQGFAIVSAEGNVLGYADHGTFDMQELPAQIAFWLECYEEQVEMVRSGRASVHRAAIVHSDIAPLVHTLWNQNEPYNTLAPSFTYSGSTIKCATGCVATAMAQILRYWSAPQPTKDIPAYTSKKLLKAMPALPATTFNYNIMQNSYSPAATGTSADEVARLMLYCGQAAEMDYYQTSTAVATGSYLADYFGFNPNFADENRWAYSCTEWDELIYNELKNGRPVIYSGAKYTNDGHSFIVDGYKNGLFHINWGWGGSYDGYFKLSEADANGGGTGAGNGAGGYSFRQRAITRLQPTAMEPKPGANAMTVNKLTTSQLQTTRTSATNDFTLPITLSVWNFTGAAKDYFIGLGLYQNGTLKGTYRVNTTAIALPNNGGKTYSNVNIELGGGTETAQYVIKAMYRESDSDPWVEDLGSDGYNIRLTVNGNTLTATPPVENSLVVNRVNFEGSKKAGRQLTAKVSITNKGVEHEGGIWLVIGSTRYGGTGVHIDQNETDEVQVLFTPMSVGTQTVRILDANTQQELWSGSITVEERPDPNISLTGTAISPQSAVGRVSGTTLNVSTRILNNASTAFDDELIFRIYRVIEGTNSGIQVMEKKVDAVIPVGESREVSVSFDQLEVGATYWVSIYVLKPSANTLLRLLQSGMYVIEAGASGIELPTTDKAEPSAVYDLQGRSVQTMDKKGIYIVNGKKVVIK